MSDRDGAAREFEFVVEAGKAREFARAAGCGDGDELGEHAHPAFLVASAHWMRPEHSAMPARDPARAWVHAAQRFAYPGGLVRVGTALRARQRVSRRWVDEGTRATTEYVELSTDFWADAGPSATMTTLVARRAAEPGAASGPDASEPMRDAEQPAHEDAPGRLPSGPPHAVLRATLAATVRY
ncbi:MAG: hypothetical protein QM602_04640, partial [Microbacterium sp.]